MSSVDPAPTNGRGIWRCLLATECVWTRLRPGVYQEGCYYRATHEEDYDRDADLPATCPECRGVVRVKTTELVGDDYPVTVDGIELVVRADVTVDTLFPENQRTVSVSILEVWTPTADGEAGPDILPLLSHGTVAIIRGIISSGVLAKTE